jgi:hypothetical protein
MDQPYSAWADALSKFHTASEPIQALCILALSVTVLGVTGLVTWGIRDIACALLMRGAGRRPRTILAPDGQGRVIVRAQEEPALIEQHRPIVMPSRHGRT